jgi:hypothetical protein
MSIHAQMAYVSAAVPYETIQSTHRFKPAYSEVTAEAAGCALSFPGFHVNYIFHG